MSFTSLEFYAWLAAAVLVFHCLPARFRVACLVLVSCAFYLTFSLRYFVLLAATTLVVYWVGLRVSTAKEESERTWFFVLGLAPVLGVLVVFKILNVSSLGIGIPIGLSYYTFKLISYLCEVYWDEQQVERSVLRFAAFSTFGAQMVSGPIQRHFDFLPQLTLPRFQGSDYAFIESGFRLILGGLMLKLVIGDRLGDFIAVVDRDPAHYTWSVLVVSTLCYLLYLFADFAGYTNIAIGIGRLFGIQSPPNFFAPFSATNMQDFWRRWHMSLTSWLGDYVFTPLRMQTRAWGNAGLIFSVLVNMILIGIWHGLTWTYLIFGIFHGIVLAWSVMTLKPKDRFFGKYPILKRIDGVVGIGSTFLLMTFSQIFFQAASLQSALLHLRLLLGLQSPGSATFQDIPSDVFAPVAICMAVSFYVGFGMPRLTAAAEFWNRLVPNWFSYGLGVLLLSSLANVTGSRFIYGQF